MREPLPKMEVNGQPTSLSQLQAVVRLGLLRPAAGLRVLLMVGVFLGVELRAAIAVQALGV